jgi:hypothetical protein
MTAKKQKHIIFEKGTGNVFADIGFANSEREQLKAHLTLQITESLRTAISRKRKLGPVNTGV